MEINFDDLREQVRKEHEEAEKSFYEFLGNMGKPDEELEQSMHEALEKMKAERQAEAEKAITEAKEKAAEEIAAEYRKANGAEAWNKTPADRALEIWAEELTNPT